MCVALRYAVLVPYCSDDKLSSAKLFNKKERGEIKKRDVALIGEILGITFFTQKEE